MATGKTAKRRATGPPADYMDLIRRFPLRPIQSESELDRAIDLVDELTDRPRLSSSSADYLETLSLLIEHYEDVEYPMPDDAVTDADMLRHLIESKGVNQAQAAHGAGIAESTVSDVLTGRRQLTRTHIEKFARYFNVPATVFLHGRAESAA